MPPVQQYSYLQSLGRLVTISSIALILLASAGTVSAQPSQTAESAETIETKAIVDASVNSPDPRVDQGFFMPTARIQPKGSFSVFANEVLHVGMTYAFTDRIQLTVSTIALPTVVTSLGVAIKIGLYDNGSTRLTLYAHGMGFTLGEDEDNALAIGGLVLSQCLNPRCTGEVTLFASGGQYRFYEESMRVFDSPIANAGISFGFQVSNRAKFILESQAFIGQNEGALFSIMGVRLHTRNFAADLGMGYLNELKEERYDGGDFPSAIPVPWLSFGYRWM